MLVVGGEAAAGLSLLLSQLPEPAELSLLVWSVLRAGWGAVDAAALVCHGYGRLSTSALMSFRWPVTNGWQPDDSQ